MKVKHKKAVKKSGSFNAKVKEIQNLQNEISFWHKKIKKRTVLSNNLITVLEKIADIHDVYGKNKKLVLNIHTEYRELIKSKSKLKSKISKIPPNAEINIKLKSLSKSLSGLKNEKPSPPASTYQRPNSTIEIEWSNISFRDNYITAVHNGHWFENFPIKNSRKSLNIIKSHYRFKKAPKLILEINGQRILRIINIEVLFYYILFLQNAGTLFDDKLFTSIEAFKTYTKQFYKVHMPDLFQPKCFSFLCKYSSDILPIIPVAEVVINTNGVSQIHDSFLFPIVSRLNIFWIWESIEESKATYIFKTNLTSFESTIQTVYDYLTGDTINKRETIIHSPNLKSFLNYTSRKMHYSFNEWASEIMPFLT